MTAQVLKAKTHREDVATGLDAAARKKIAATLKAALADTMLLQIKSQAYHWNVVGPAFFSLHKLTEEHYNDMFAAVDELAERIRALGEVAPLSFAELAKAAALKEESGVRNAGEMVEQLASDHEKLSRQLREGAAMAEENGDFATHDLLTGRLAFHEKAIWMLRAIVS